MKIKMFFLALMFAFVPAGQAGMDSHGHVCACSGCLPPPKEITIADREEDGDENADKI